MVPVDADEQAPAPQRGSHTARWLFAAVVLIVAGMVGVVLVQDGDEDDREATATPGRTPRNGPIVAGNGDGWPDGASAPEQPDGMGGFEWDAVDPDSGSFLYASSERILILDAEGGEEADFPCGVSVCGVPAFGPGSDEVTIPVNSQQRLQFPAWDGTLQVTAWDGTVRDTLDLSDAFSHDANGTPEQFLPRLSWSPDGSRLAVGLEPACEPSRDPCASQIWVVDRDGGEPQLVHTAASDRTADVEGWSPSHLGDLSWSPDGNSLGVVVATRPLGRLPTPTLVMIRLRSGVVRSEVLHVYSTRSDNHIYQNDYGVEFPFAWSPDGTRIAVGSDGVVSELSAQDGSILARHTGAGHEASHDVAWLPGD